MPLACRKLVVCDKVVPCKLALVGEWRSVLWWNLKAIGMAMDILFKPWVEATEQMAQNCMDILQSKNHRIQVTCIITVCSSHFLFQFYFTPENPS